MSRQTRYGTDEEQNQDQQTGMEIVVTPYNDEPKLVTKPSSLVRDGYPADIWVLCAHLLGQYDADMVVHLQNRDGDNWLVEEKSLEMGVIQQDCVYLTVEHQTDAAILVDKYGVGSPDGVTMRQPIADTWLPKSQLTSFERRESHAGDS